VTRRRCATSSRRRAHRRRGLSPKPTRPSHGVRPLPAGRGLQIVPVNRALHDSRREELPYAHRRRGDHTIDIVDVFRRSEFVGAIVDEAIGLQSPPRLIWLQLGVVDDAAQTRAQAAGIPCVTDRCLMVEHRALGV